MRCIFCKTISNTCTSVEHVLPESFGNKEHVLPAGWVCHSCNNYFAIKVEQPFLESQFGRSIRHFMGVPSKKGRIPSTFGTYPLARCRIELFYDEQGMLCVSAAEGASEPDFIRSLQSNATGRFYIPDPVLPDSSYATSRFVAKLGLEILALRCADVPTWNDDVVDKAELDELRNYARRGNPAVIWPVSIRQIYPRDFIFPADSESGSHQILHEWTILATPTTAPEIYAVIAIFGVEFVINLGGPNLDGWNRWLSENERGSPLYPKEMPINGRKRGRS
jgi:hypothetical protein